MHWVDLQILEKNVNKTRDRKTFDSETRFENKNKSVERIKKFTKKVDESGISIR